MTGGSYRRVGPTQAVSVLSISCKIRSCSVVYSIGSFSAMIVVCILWLSLKPHTHTAVSTLTVLNVTSWGRTRAAWNPLLLSIIFYYYCT